MPYNRSLILAVFTLIFILFFPGPTLCAIYSNPVESLRDLNGIYVLAEGIEREVEKDGLSNSVIAMDIGQRLKASGITVLSREKWLDTSGSPYLYLNANILKLRQSAEYIYSINLSFKQNVYTVRAPVEIIGAATWTTGGIVGITSKLENIRRLILEKVEEFVEAFLLVNKR